MARMYSKSKGKSGSKRPATKETPVWVSYKAGEVEALVTKLGKEKISPSAIGLKLRDSYGVPSIRQVTGKKVAQILEEKKVAKSLPQDMIDCIAKYINVKKHIEENKQDRTAMRGLTLALSRIQRLKTYYIRTGKISKDWKFEADRAGVYIE